MPNETQQTIDWTLAQTWTNQTTGESFPITKDMATEVVNHLCEYFNENNIDYSNFS